MTALSPRFDWERHITDSDLPAPSRHVALTLATWFSRQAAVCHPSVETLAAKTGLSRSTVQHHLGILRDQGWLTVHSGAGASRRSDRRPNEYEATVPPAALRGPGAGPRSAPRGPGAGRNGARELGPNRPSDQTSNTSESTPSATTGGNGKRPRDPLFDALACAGRRVDLEHLPASSARTIAVKLAELRAAQPDVTPEEIGRRARRYRAEHPDWALTPASLVKHWAELAPGGTRPAAQRCNDCGVQGPLSVCSLGADYRPCPGNVVRPSEEASR